jgi:hypothetical protein
MDFNFRQKIKYWIKILLFSSSVLIVGSVLYSITSAMVSSILQAQIASYNFWTRNQGLGYLYPAILSDKVGIGTSTPIFILDVAGGKIGIDGIQVIYRTDAFGSLIFGDGGAHLLHIAGDTGYYNTFFGLTAGRNNTTGYANLFIGTQAGLVNTTGYYNTFIGNNSALANVNGVENTFVGQASGPLNTFGSDNVFVGQYSGGQNTSGSDNTFIGQEAGSQNVTGSRNVYIGRLSGGSPYLFYAGATGSGNILIGYYAGSHETGSNTLLIDNQERASEVDQRTKALIYGIFDAAIANQKLFFNAAQINLPYLPIYPDNATASGAGLAAGRVYRTATGVLMVVY